MRLCNSKESSRSKAAQLCMRLRISKRRFWKTVHMSIWKMKEYYGTMRKEVRMRTTMTRIKNRNTTPLLPSKDSRLGEVGGARGDSMHVKIRKWLLLIPSRTTAFEGGGLSAFCLKSWTMRWTTAERTTLVVSKMGWVWINTNHPCRSGLFIKLVSSSAVHNKMSSTAVTSNFIVIQDIDRIFPCSELCNGNIEGLSMIVTII